MNPKTEQTETIQMGSQSNLPMIKLSGGQIKQLHQALLSAFPNIASLQFLVRTELEKNLDAIAGGNNLSEITFQLINWAETHGTLKELIQRAYQANPSNPALSQFVLSLLRGSVLELRSNSDIATDTLVAVTYTTRLRVREAIEPLLAENKEIFDAYGPNKEYCFDPESEMPTVWKRKILSRVLPNNRRLLAILDRNRQHLTANERRILEAFRQHVDDFEQRHIGDGGPSGGMRFPEGMNRLLGDE